MTKWNISQRCLNIQKSINVIHYINRIKPKNYRVILIDTEKTFDKSQYLFIIKILYKLGIKGNFLDLIQGTYKNSILSSEYLNVFPLRSGIRKRMAAFATSIQYCRDFTGQLDKKKEKKNLYWERNKTLFTHDMIF